MCTTEVHSQATSLSWLLSLGCGGHWLSPHRARSRCNPCESDRRVTDSQWRGVERFPCRSDCYPLGLVAFTPLFRFAAISFHRTYTFRLRTCEVLLSWKRHTDYSTVHRPQHSPPMTLKVSKRGCPHRPSHSGASTPSLW